MSGIKRGTWGTCRANIGGVSSSKIEDCLKDCFFWFGLGALSFKLVC